MNINFQVIYLPRIGLNTFGLNTICLFDVVACRMMICTSHAFGCNWLIYLALSTHFLVCNWCWTSDVPNAVSVSALFCFVSPMKSWPSTPQISRHNCRTNRSRFHNQILDYLSEDDDAESNWNFAQQYLFNKKIDLKKERKMLV